MELRDLKAFVTLGEVLHFGQAALRQHVTQSALSKQIQRLETELGGALFERNANSTQLTSLGRALYADACQLVDKSAQLSRTAREVLAGHQGCLRIGFGVASNRLVPAAIARFRAERPQVTIELSDLSTHHQILALNDGRLDIGFCRLPAPKGWPALPVVTARFVAVIPTSYPPTTILADLRTLPLVTLRRDQAPSFQDHLMSYLAQSGLRFVQQPAVSDFPAIVGLAAAGIAWGIVPSSFTVDHPEVRTLTLTDAEAAWTIGMMRPPGTPDPLVQAFWEIVTALVLADARPADDPSTPRGGR